MWTLGLQIVGACNGWNSPETVATECASFSGNTSLRGSPVLPALPRGCRIAFSWGRNAARVMSCPFYRKTEILCAEKYLLLRPISAVSTGKVCSTRVIRQEFAVAERKQMIPVIGIPICAIVVGKAPGMTIISW
jgi:hypothetical protein